MHKYRNTKIAQEMRALKPGVSELDQYIAALVMSEVHERGNWEQLVVIGAHETLIPAVLGGIGYNYVVYALVTPPVGYMERQWSLLRLARMRYDGRCLARLLQSPYKAMANFGDTRFRHIIVMPDVDFDRVRDYCRHYLREDGVMIVAQRGSGVEIGDFIEIWRKHLKMTDAGHCIECEEKEAEWVVAGTVHHKGGNRDNGET